MVSAILNMCALSKGKSGSNIYSVHEIRQITVHTPGRIFSPAYFHTSVNIYSNIFVEHGYVHPNKEELLEVSNRIHANFHLRPVFKWKNSKGTSTKLP